MLKSVLVRLVLRIAYRSLDELTIEGVRFGVGAPSTEYRSTTRTHSAI